MTTCLDTMKCIESLWRNSLKLPPRPDYTVCALLFAGSSLLFVVGIKSAVEADLKEKCPLVFLQCRKALEALNASEKTHHIGSLADSFSTVEMPLLLCSRTCSRST